MEAKPQTVRRRGRPPRQREDLADTRELLLRTLRTLAPPPPRTTRKRVIEPF